MVELGFVLFVCVGFVEKELAFGEPAGAQETIERGSHQTSLGLLVGQRQLAAAERRRCDAGSRA